MAKGRWRTKIVKLDLEKIKALLSADTKRRRTNYDSYGLVMAHKNASSEVWTYEEIMNMNYDDGVDLGFPMMIT